MKKVSYFMMAALFAASSMFVSCGEDDAVVPDPIPPVVIKDAPTISFKFGEKAIGAAGATESVKIGDAVDVEINYVADGEIKEIELTIGAADNKETITTFATATTHKITKTLKAEFDEKKNIVITTKITDKQSPAKEATFTFTINVEENELEEDDFEWKRVGGAAGTGLAAFGLAWTQNSNALEAIIVPLAGTDLFRFDDTSVYDKVTTKEGLVKLFDDNVGVKINDFRGVSASVASKTYDIVLGTKVKVGSEYEYYLLRIDNSSVSTAASGTTIVVTGKYSN